MPCTLPELASLSFNAADPITLESPTFQINGVSTSHPTTPTHYEYKDTYGIFLSDMYDLQHKYFPNQEINYEY